MIVIEYSPDRLLTGILRTTLQIIRAVSHQTDIFLLTELIYPNYEIPKLCSVKKIARNSITNVFDDDLLSEIANLPNEIIKRKLIENCTIFYPRWRPSKRYFSKEVGIIYDCSPIFRSYDFQNSSEDYFRRHLKLSSELNDLTITISEFSRREIESLVAFPSGKLIRIYPGSSFNPVELRSVAMSKTKSKIPYCIFVGSLDPRKAIFEILSWWTANGLRLGYEQLILIGSIPGWSPQTHQTKIAKTISNTNRVEFLGSLPDSKVFQLLTGASLCLYPSKYEGFGLPVCDSIFAGIKVLTSNKSATAEFARAGALLVEPERPWHWNEMICAPEKESSSVDDLLQTYDWLNFAKAILSI